MAMMDFDAWRAAYDNMTYLDQVSFYREAWEHWPDQRHFDAETARRFFAAIGPVDRVVEVGGWRGELAAELLPDLEVRWWKNYEISSPAVGNPVCDHPAYSGYVPAKFVWECPRVRLDVLVASHVIEHMRWHQLKRLFEWAEDANAIYLASPLPEDVPDWHGYPGTHILEAGWNRIETFLLSQGYWEMVGLRTHEVRCFSR